MNWPTGWHRIGSYISKSPLRSGIAASPTRITHVEFPDTSGDMRDVFEDTRHLGVDPGEWALKAWIGMRLFSRQPWMSEIQLTGVQSARK